MTASGRDAIDLMLTDGILRVTINRPARRNAVDFATLDALGEVLVTEARADEVRVVVLSGADGSFCSGADLAAAAEGPLHTPEETMDKANRAVRAIVTLDVPVIAEVAGAAVGYGVALALASDFVVASDDAYFLLAFTKNGLMPDGGATLMVPAILGRAKANALLLLGERLPAGDALREGLVSAVHPRNSLERHTKELAVRLASGPRRAQALTKRAVTVPLVAQLDEALAREKAGQCELLAGAEFAEALTARFEKRAPVFG
ncbi:enoyl-CoA hydratase [Hoyosella subflava]|uniref:Putative enoyl-CoA hydratase n=1 Tax=Hoyosella subflava (strain DSM 45089 / JCM 17490 / NBRC 109087 / DQS3-9A1) TaxID=443218 RepID=F6EHB6_HOYSD|nr:enoyl-CoA hydratase [Hoyosella subflava]AEF41095.1 Putative enoyl-CoA hydratase [Hoyosella subflava DQS3-9A1]